MAYTDAGLILDSLARPISYAPNEFERGIINECKAMWDKAPWADPRKKIDGHGSLGIVYALRDKRIITEADRAEDRRQAHFDQEIANFKKNFNDHTHSSVPKAATPEWLPVQAKDETKLIIEVSTSFDIARYPHHCGKCGAPSYKGLIKEDCVNAQCSNFTA